MPTLKKNEEKIERLYLPSTEKLPEEEKAFVDMDVRPVQTGDIEDVNPELSQISISIEMLTERIKGWNFTDEAGAAVPVSIETVKLLDVEDFIFLGEIINKSGKKGLTPAEKKA